MTDDYYVGPNSCYCHSWAIFKTSDNSKYETFMDKKKADHICKLLNSEDDILLLHALERAGVDNWEGYEFAIDILEEMKEEKRQ